MQSFSLIQKNKQELTEELLTVKEVAEILKLSPSTVRKYLRTGLLPKCKLGGAVRIPRQELEEIIRRHTRTIDVKALVNDVIKNRL